METQTTSKVYESPATPIQRDGSFDSTHALFSSEGYEFISNRCRRYGIDIFETRIMLKKVFCIRGAEAAEQFYHPGRFTRRNALPWFAYALIQEQGSIVGLDGEDHRRRKAMFLSLMSPPDITRIAELTAYHWRKYAAKWAKWKKVNLLQQAHRPLCAAICEWCGLNLSPWQIKARAREFEAMVEGTGSMGPRNWLGQLQRARTERWMRNVVREIRSYSVPVAPRSPAHIITTFRDRNGQLLDVKSAAIELVNILRPTVANARYIVFAAMALHSNPEWRERLGRSDDGLDAFVNEVRRCYPFIPVIGGRVLEPFSWQGHQFHKDAWFLFDIYGTNHDHRIWGDAYTFRPERFKERTITPYNLVSHGAGDHWLTHRCPGEWITIEQMKTIVRILVREMSYEVPPQDLGINLARIPARPESGFIINNVQLRTNDPCCL